MDRLERLYQESRSLDPQLAEIARKESERQEKIRQEKTKEWEQMCDDILALSKYSLLMDTRVPVFEGSEAETIGFDIYGGEIKMISWLHKNCDGKAYETPRRHTCFFSISRDIPYKNSAPSSLTCFVDRLGFLADNWEKILPVLEDDIATRLERGIREKKKTIEEAAVI